MRVFLAGATGAIGRRLVPALVARGHAVTGTTRSREKLGMLREMGARGVVLDALDREAVLAAVREAAPEVVIHQLTDLASLRGFRNFDREFAGTNRLRVEATDHLLEAALRSGARRIIVQSYGAWPYERAGASIKREEDRLDPDPPAKQRESLSAIRHLESVVLGARGIEGIVLRYAGFYGPGTSLGPGGAVVELVRRRRLPVIGAGAGVWSFIHVDDAAAATAAAVERGPRGIFNIADDDPAPAAEWIPELARILDAPRPRRVPVWVGRLAAGEVGVSMMTQIRGMSNEKARRELGWAPAYASWRTGFRAMMHAADASTRSRTGG